MGVNKTMSQNVVISGLHTTKPLNESAMSNGTACHSMTRYQNFEWNSVLHLTVPYSCSVHQLTCFILLHWDSFCKVTLMTEIVQVSEILLSNTTLIWLMTSKIFLCTSFTMKPSNVTFLGYLAPLMQQSWKLPLETVQNPLGILQYAVLDRGSQTQLK